MAIENPFVVSARYGGPPSSWYVTVATKETPKTLVKEGDTRWSTATIRKVDVKGRFASQADADAFKARMQAIWDQHDVEIRALRHQRNALDNTIRELSKARDEAIAQSLEAA